MNNKAKLHEEFFDLIDRIKRASEESGVWEHKRYGCPCLGGFCAINDFINRLEKIANKIL